MSTKEYFRKPYMTQGIKKHSDYMKAIPQKAIDVQGQIAPNIEFKKPYDFHPNTAQMLHYYSNQLHYLGGDPVPPLNDPSLLHHAPVIEPEAIDRGPRTNIALNATATAESEFDAPTHRIIYGNDGNIVTAWWGLGLSHWWQVDFSKAKTFDIIYVQTEALAYSLTITGSNDNSTFIPILTDPVATRGTLTKLPSFGEKTFRYVRIICASPTQVATLREMQVWGWE